jgi:hypothetical protein
MESLMRVSKTSWLQLDAKLAILLAKNDAT